MDYQLNFCRICMKKETKYFSLFDKNEYCTNLTNSELVMMCSSVQIIQYDGFSDKICKNCLHNLQISYDFKITSENSDRIMKETFNFLIKNENEIQNNEIQDNDNIHADEIAIESDIKDYGLLEANFSEQEQNNDDKKITKARLKNISKGNGKILKRKRLTQIIKDDNIVIDFTKQCLVCDLVFKSFGDLREHRKIHTEVVCNICKTKICNYNALKKHTAEIHFLTGLSSCPYCSKVLKSSSSLKDHIKQKHTTERKYLCEKCSKGFLKKTVLRDHLISVHKKERNFVCPECGKKYATANMLRLHILRHTDIRNFTCKICDKSFKMGRDLRGHMEYHSDVKRWTCKFCFKAFTKSHHLKCHERIHTGERPVKCKICNQGFAQRASLKYHEEKFHKTLNYEIF